MNVELNDSEQSKQELPLNSQAYDMKPTRSHQYERGGRGATNEAFKYEMSMTMPGYKKVQTQIERDVLKSKLNDETRI